MMDFGKRCVNCRHFSQEHNKDSFGKCDNPVDREVFGKVHMFSSCSGFEEQAQHLRPAIAQRVDFDLERKNTGWDKFLTR